MSKQTKVKYNKAYIQVLSEHFGVTPQTIKRWYREIHKKKKE